MNGDGEAELRELRDEVAHLLAQALRVADATGVAADRVRLAHEAELTTLQQGYERERVRLEHERDEIAAEVRRARTKIANMDAAVATRDIIGQAKGIIMSAMHCSAETAFDLLAAQSQAENRKLIDVATDIVSTVVRRSAAAPASSRGPGDGAEVAARRPTGSGARSASGS